MNKKHVNLLGVYEIEEDITYPAAMIMVVQEEGFNICDSEYYLNLMIEQELGLECEFNVAIFDLNEDEVPSMYATPKLIKEAFDTKQAFADHFMIRVDEDYLFDLETSLR